MYAALRLLLVQLLLEVLCAVAVCMQYVIITVDTDTASQTLDDGIRVCDI